MSREPWMAVATRKSPRLVILAEQTRIILAEQTLVIPESRIGLSGIPCLKHLLLAAPTYW